MALPATSLTINDGANTPVAQTFSITDRTGLMSAFRNGAASLVRGAQNLVHRVSLGKNKGAANAVMIELSYPVEGTVEGQTAVIRTHKARAEIFFSPDAPELERQTFYGLFANALAHADVKQATVKLVSIA